MLGYVTAANSFIKIWITIKEGSWWQVAITLIKPPRRPLKRSKSRMHSVLVLWVYSDSNDRNLIKFEKERLRLARRTLKRGIKPQQK